MNVHDIPMVIFTVVSQMAVGTFIALGVIQLVLGRRHDAQVREHVMAPVTYAVGPVLVLGLIVSIFHVNDVTHIHNVVRGWQSSWLAREILFGLAFAVAGFAFALLNWFQRGSAALRQWLAALTALLGVGLLWSEAMIYYSLEAVPAWHTWVVPFEFVATAVLLGVLAVGAAMMVTTEVRARVAPPLSAGAAGAVAPTGDAEAVDAVDAVDAERDSEAAAPAASGLMAQIRGRIREINAPTTEHEWTLTVRILKAIAVVGAVVAVAIIVVSTIYVGDLSQGNAVARESAAVLSGGRMLVRLLLAGATAILLGFAVYRLAMTTRLANSRTLVRVVLVTGALAVSGEVLGRLLHYEAMLRVGF